MIEDVAIILHELDLKNTLLYDCIAVIVYRIISQ